MSMLKRIGSGLVIAVVFGTPTLAQNTDVRKAALPFCEDSTISFAPTRKADEMRCRINGPHGSSYQLALEPQEDLNGNVIGLNLDVVRLGMKTLGNVLEINDKVHGYQPFNFAASDFERGAPNSIYGKTRQVQNKKLKILITIDVLDSQIEPTSHSNNYYRFQFGSMTFRVDVKDMNSSIATLK